VSLHITFAWAEILFRVVGRFRFMGGARDICVWVRLCISGGLGWLNVLVAELVLCAYLLGCVCCI
jgi:hypothetical protein